MIWKKRSLEEPIDTVKQRIVFIASERIPNETLLRDLVTNRAIPEESKRAVFIASESTLPT